MNYAEVTSEDAARLGQFAHAAYSTVEGIQHTFLLAQQTLRDGIPGDFVECGVAAGALAAAMGYALQKHGQARSFHLFDSFEGIPLAGPNDTSQPGLDHFLAERSLPVEERLRSSGISVGTVDAVRNNLRNWGLGGLDWQYHVGWFQRTLPTVGIARIAMLRLDGDLYESTECCLSWLYHRVSPGGCVILDDYPLPGSRKAMEEYFERFPPRPDIRVEVGTGAAHWFKP